MRRNFIHITACRFSKLLVCFMLFLMSSCNEKQSSKQTNLQEKPLPELKVPELKSSHLSIRVLITNTPAVFELSSNFSFDLEYGKPAKVMHVKNATSHKIIKISDHQVKFGTLGILNLPVKMISKSSSQYFETADHRYAGNLIMQSNQHGISLINEIDLEQYIASVVDSEMPISFGHEARKAQAIIARTYALSHILLHREYQPYDLTDTVRHQRYHGHAYKTQDLRWLSSSTPEAQKVIAETRNQICTFHNLPFVTYYCACCGGHTFNSEELFNRQVPDIQGQKDPWCRDSPDFNWNVRIPRQKAISSLFNFINQLPEQKQKEIKFENLSGMSRVQPVDADKIPRWTVKDGNRKFVVSSLDLKKLWEEFHIPSPNFQIQITATDFILQGHGAGHCVGLCQWGAKGMAQNGKTAHEIINHYYQEIKIADWTTLKLKIKL